MGILDFLFPKHCVSCKKLGDYLCPACFSYLSFDTVAECIVCNRPAAGGITHPRCVGRYTIDGAFTSICYKGIAKKLIYKFKYKPYLSGLKNLLVDLLFEGVIQKEEFARAYREKDNNFSILVPIPLYRSKLRARGYNQAEILANGLSKKLNIKMANILQRTKNTRSQVGLKREDRIKNISNAFSIIPNPNILISQYPNIFLIDDVLTTGSTLSEAANVLKRNGAKKVWGIALARD